MSKDIINDWLVLLDKIRNAFMHIISQLIPVKNMKAHRYGFYDEEPGWRCNLLSGCRPSVQGRVREQKSAFSSSRFLSPDDIWSNQDQIRSRICWRLPLSEESSGGIKSSYAIRSCSLQQEKLNFLLELSNQFDHTRVQASRHQEFHGDPASTSSTSHQGLQAPPARSSLQMPTRRL